MAFQVLIPNAVKKDLKKLDKQVSSAIKTVIFEKVAVSPHLGNPLQGLPKIHAWKLRFRNADYRIAYKIDFKAQLVYLILVKSRENFYKELGRRLG